MFVWRCFVKAKEPTEGVAWAGDAEAKSAILRQLDSTTYHKHPQRLRNRSARATTRKEHTCLLTDMSINPRAGVLRASLRLLMAEGTA